MPIGSSPEGVLDKSSKQVEGKVNAGMPQIVHIIGAINEYDINVVVVVPAYWPSFIEPEPIAAVLETVIPADHLGTHHVERVALTEMGTVTSVRNAAITVTVVATVVSHGLWLPLLLHLLCPLRLRLLCPLWLLPVLHLLCTLWLLCLLCPLGLRLLCTLWLLCLLCALWLLCLLRALWLLLVLRLLSSSLFCANTGRVAPRSKNRPAVVIILFWFISVASNPSHIRLPPDHGRQRETH